MKRTACPGLRDDDPRQDSLLIIPRFPDRAWAESSGTPTRLVLRCRRRDQNQTRSTRSPPSVRAMSLPPTDRAGRGPRGPLVRRPEIREAGQSIGAGPVVDGNSDPSHLRLFQSRRSSMLHRVEGNQPPKLALRTLLPTQRRGHYRKLFGPLCSVDRDTYSCPRDVLPLILVKQCQPVYRKLFGPTSKWQQE